MTTRKRFRNKFRLQLREHDHLPMHVHLVGGEINVRIDLESLTIVEGRCPAGLWREVREWLVGNRDILIGDWKKWHP